MENDKKEEEKPEATPPAEASFARIASDMSDIKSAVYLIAVVTLLTQFFGTLKGKSEESKALWSVSHSLDTIHEDLKKTEGPDGAVQWQLRELNKNLSNINSTIWEKSCSR